MGIGLDNLKMIMISEITDSKILPKRVAWSHADLEFNLYATDNFDVKLYVNNEFQNSCNLDALSLIELAKLLQLPNILT